MESLKVKMKQNCFFLPELVFKILGISVAKKKSSIYKCYTVFMLFMGSLYSITNAHLLINNIDDYDIVVNSLFNVVGGIGGVAKAIGILWKANTFAAVFNKIDYLQEQFGKNMHIQQEVYNINKMILLGIIVFYSNLFYFYASTLIGRVLNGNDSDKWKLPIIQTAILNTTYSPNYEIGWTFHAIAATVTSSTYCFSDYLISAILINITIQFRIFRKEIDTAFNYLQNEKFPNFMIGLKVPDWPKTIKLVIKSMTGIMRISKEGIPTAISRKSFNYLDARFTNATTLRTTKEWMKMQKLVKQIVKQHTTLINLAQDVEDACNGLIFVAVLTGLIITSFSLYYASVNPLLDFSAVISYFEAVTVMATLFLMCYCSSELTKAGESISSACYEINFVGTDVRFQKSLLLIMTRCTKPVKITVGRFSSLSIEVFAWIVRSIYTYLMVLRKSNQNLEENSLY